MRGRRRCWAQLIKYHKMAKKKTKHIKGDVIKHGGKYYQCVCVDSELAVFAPMTKTLSKVKYKDMFVCSPSYTDKPLLNFEYVTNKTK